jgi:parvulin-like peptidyl-prolyl isomerase
VRIAIRTLPPLVLLALVLSACGAGGNPADAAEVNGESIPIAAVESRFESVAANPQFADQFAADEDGTLTVQVQSGILTELIRAKLWEQGAADLGIEITEDDVEARREQIVEEVGGQDAFDDLVEQSGLTEPILAAEIRSIVVRERVEEELAEDVEVTDEEVEAFYADAREDRYETVEARHILVETEREAEDALARLDEGEDFADVAEDVSIDTGSAEQCGDLGEFSRGRMVPEFEDAAFEADVGEIVGPVESQFGFHIIEVTGRSEQELDEVADEIRDELRSGQQGETIDSWFADLLATADVIVNPRFGEWDADAGEVVPTNVLGDEEAETAPVAPADPAEPELNGDPTDDPGLDPDD